MRRSAVLFAALVVLVGLTGCSVTQVRTWFAVYAHKDISVDEAWGIADRINAKATPGCDDNYWGRCVPDNATDVDCAGTGDGPVWVTGPILVTRWDHFGLDPDGDKVACPPPPPAPAPPLTHFGEVMVAVGRGPGQVPPGRYVTTAAPGSECDWDRIGAGQTVLGGNTFTGLEFMDVKAGDTLATDGPCTWAPAAASRYPVPPSGDASFRVGVEIQAGTYRTSGADGCRWIVESAFDGSLETILAANASRGPQLVTIDPTDVGFESRGCGTWTRLDPPPDRTLTLISDGEPLLRGEVATWTDADGPILMAGSSAVSFGVPGINIGLSAPNGQSLEVGRYDGAVRAAVDPTRPGLDVIVAGGGCNTVSGWFQIVDIQRDQSGQIIHLTAAFEHHCNGGGAALRGIISV